VCVCVCVCVCFCDMFCARVHTDYRRLPSRTPPSRSHLSLSHTRRTSSFIHGSLPSIKYTITYTSSSISSRRLCRHQQWTPQKKAFQVGEAYFLEALLSLLSRGFTKVTYFLEEVSLSLITQGFTKFTYLLEEVSNTYLLEEVYLLPRG
jgi:hypothetical protein